VFAGILASRCLRGDHLSDLPYATLAVRARLAAVLDLPQRARATSDLFGDAPVGDTFADADQHGAGLISLLKIVFNSEKDIAECDRGKQVLNLEVEIVVLCAAGPLIRH
jgi:hypothetical protein